MIKRSSALAGNLAILLAVIFWGLSFVSMKQLIQSGIPPFTMIAIRYGIVCLIYFILLLFIKKQAQKPIQDHWLLFLSGFVGITTYFIFEAKGIEFTTASAASMIIATVPIYSILVDIFYFKNKATLLQWAGIILSIAGVFLIIKPSASFALSSHQVIGNALMLGACFSWVLYSVLSRKLHDRYSNLEITALQSLYASWPFFLLSLTEKTKWVPIAGIHWIHFLFLAFVCSVLSYFLYQVALQKLGITVVSAYINLIPVVGVIGSVWLLKEKVTFPQVLGGIIVIFALFMVNKKPESPLV